MNIKQHITLVEDWWIGISEREQRLLMAFAGALALAVLFVGIIQPINNRIDTAQSRHQSEKKLLNWVEEKADTIYRLRAQQGESTSSLPLNQAIASTALEFDAELVRVQQRDNELQVWIQPMPFNRFVEWLVFLDERHGISATFVDMNKDNQEGMVDIKRLQFVKG